MMKNAGGTTVLVATMLLLAAAAPNVFAGGAPDKSQIFDIAEGGLTTTADDPEPVVGSRSMLWREDDAVHIQVRSQIDGGHAYTLWWLIFNNPDACDGECGEDDIFVDPANHFPDAHNPVAGLRIGQIRAAQISAVWGGGAVANPAGRWKLDGTLREGQPPGGPGQVLLGTGAGGAIVPVGVVDGLTNAEGAQFLLLIQDHGPAHDDPELLTRQLTTFLGACNPQPADLTVFPPDHGSCAEVQFSVHR